MTTRRTFITTGLGVAAGTALTRFAPGQAANPQAPATASPIDPMQLVNPQFRPYLQDKPFLLSPHEANTAYLPTMRQNMKRAARPLLATPEVLQRTIPGPKGAPEVTVYITGVLRGALRPAVLHMHGGGFIAGSAADSRRNIQEIAVTHDCVAVSVEYRLAPETTFPGPLEDSYAALSWLYTHAAELGVDRTRIAVKGESAGGWHAAALSILARDRGEFPICLQVLVYPTLDDRTGSSINLPPYLGRYVWTPQATRFSWSTFLGMPVGSSVPPPYSVPARVNNLAGLPPAWIGVGSVDLFATEDMEYARRLLQAGVPTEFLLVPGAVHGFNQGVPEAPLSIAFDQSWNAALTRAFTGTKQVA